MVRSRDCIKTVWWIRSVKWWKYHYDIFTPGWRYHGGENIVSYWPRSVHKSDVECSLLEFDSAKWSWTSRSMTPTFNNSWEYPRMHVWRRFVDYTQICESYHTDKLNFLKFWFKMTLIIPAESCDELSCRQVKVDRQTDRQTDRCRLWVERPSKG